MNEDATPIDEPQRRMDFKKLSQIIDGKSKRDQQHTRSRQGGTLVVSSRHLSHR